MTIRHPRARRGLALAAVAVGSLVCPSALRAQIPLEGAAPARWIWTEPGATHPAGTACFRKRFEVKEHGSKLALDVTADNAVALYLDGKPVARSSDWRVAKAVEATLNAGPHVLAAEVTNDAPGAAGFLLRGALHPLGQVAPVHTDSSWKAAGSVPRGEGWRKVEFDDSAWGQAVDLGPLETPPWKGVVFASGEGRFRTPEGFRVSLVASPELTGSVLALAFDPEGRPCVSSERGPISRLVDPDGDGRFESKVVIAAQMSNCQGLTFGLGHLFAVGNGPEGPGIYRLDDPDGDGRFESAALLRGTTAGMQEHGPHAVVLGPDGSLYVNNGNHAHLNGPIDPKSPANVAYEGELLPHYNDPRGHAAGILAPCGEILRSDDQGKTWSRVSAGYRNAYDFAFNRDGECFTFDSDMEWDVGLPWYRPVRVLHAVPGGEFGSRNGSAVWPSYFFDGLPSTLDLGRGSPTGVTFYQGQAFPPEYVDNLLLCDWSQGRILAVSMTRDGASFRAGEPRELVSGQPLNCTDLEVGPDGAVYFATGGRSTLGGLYKLEWAGKKGPSMLKGPFVMEAVGIASPSSAFSRARIARMKAENPKFWERDLTTMAGIPGMASGFRRRALQVLHEFGPKPSEEVLVILARDRAPEVRAEALAQLGMRTSDEARRAIAGALKDDDPFVRRRACDALVRSGGPIPAAPLVPLLEDDDRHVRYAARIALEHGDPAKGLDTTTLGPRGEPTQTARGRRLALLGMVRASPMDAQASEALIRQLELEASRPSPGSEGFVETLRLIGLAYARGGIRPRDVPATEGFRQALARRFEELFTLMDTATGRLILPKDQGPKLRAKHAPIRRETARMLAFLGGPEAVPLILKAQADETDHAGQIHYAYCLRNLKEGWTPETRKQFWAWFETASRWDGGFSVLGYLDAMIADFLPVIPPAEKAEFLASAATHPFPARLLFRDLDLQAEPGRIRSIPALYSALEGSPNRSAANDLRVLILEKLGQSGTAEAHAALRDLARSDPARRDLIARALSNHPNPDDLPFLVSALESRDPNTTSGVLSALMTLDARPTGPEGPRNLLRLARRTGPAMRGPLNAIASKWLGCSAPLESSFAETMAHWERLYREQFPDAPALDADNGGQNAYTLAQLLTGVMQSPARKNASAERGKAVIARARCLDCHKLGDSGAAIGPDLSTVSSRFRPNEVLEAIVEPSKVISDQYRSTVVATTDGKVFDGLAAGGDGTSLILLRADGSRVTIPRKDIEAQKESTVSVMPEGLLNSLSFQDIADLLALFEAQPRADPSAKK